MAVRFDASTDNYSTGTNLPAGSPLTVVFWAYISTDRNARSSPWALDGGGDCFIGTASDGTTIQAWDEANYETSGFGAFAMSVGVWYKLALVVDGSNATFYRAAADDPLSSASVSDFSPCTAPNQLYIGDDDYGQWWNGRVAALKMWEAALSEAEVADELAQYAPVRTADLHRWHPFLVDETTDYSGGNRTLTAGSSAATTEPGPPIPWAVIHPTVTYVPPPDTDAAAEAATLTVAGQDATPSVKPGPELVEFTVAASDATTAVEPGAEAATLTVAAQDATVATSVVAAAEAATLTVAGQDASTEVSPTAQAASFTVSALNATVSANAQAEPAEWTLAAEDPSASVAASAAEATLTVEGFDATASVGSEPAEAGIALSALDATVTVSTTAQAAEWTLDGADPEALAIEFACQELSGAVSTVSYRGVVDAVLYEAEGVSAVAYSGGAVSAISYRAETVTAVSYEGDVDTVSYTASVTAVDYEGTDIALCGSD